MLKFKGKPWQLKCYLAYLMFRYGEKATMKEMMKG